MWIHDDDLKCFTESIQNTISKLTIDELAECLFCRLSSDGSDLFVWWTRPDSRRLIEVLSSSVWYIGSVHHTCSSHQLTFECVHLRSGKPGFTLKTHTIVQQLMTSVKDVYILFWNTFGNLCFCAQVTYPISSASESREHAQISLQRLHPRHKKLQEPHIYTVSFSMVTWTYFYKNNPHD